MRAGGVALWRGLPTRSGSTSSAEGLQRRAVADRGRAVAALRRQSAHRSPGAGSAGRRGCGAGRAGARHLRERRAAAELPHRPPHAAFRGPGGPGAGPAWGTVSSGQENASAAVARGLGLRVGARVVRIERLSHVDGRPLSRGTSWFPYQRFPQIADVFARTGSITRTFAELGVADYARASTRISHAMVRPTKSSPWPAPRQRRAGDEIVDVDADDARSSTPSPASPPTGSNWWCRRFGDGHGGLANGLILVLSGSRRRPHPTRHRSAPTPQRLLHVGRRDATGPAGRTQHPGELP